MTQTVQDKIRLDKCRLDKWLWAARFFKTRSLAKQAIEKGQVKVDGQGVKPGRDIAVGAVLQVKQGFDVRTVVVAGLSDQRGPAARAQALYCETEESLRLRTLQAAQRKAENLSAPVFDHRPNKKERRQLLGLFNEHNGASAD